MSTSLEAKIREIYRKFEDLVNEVFEFFKTYDPKEITSVECDVININPMYNRDYCRKIHVESIEVDEQDFGKYVSYSGAIRFLYGVLSNIISHRGDIEALFNDLEITNLFSSVLIRLQREILLKIPTPPDVMVMVVNTHMNVLNIHAIIRKLIKLVIEYEEKKKKEGGKS